MTFMGDYQSLLGQRSAVELVAVIGWILALYLLAAGVYNIFLHALSEYPGPRLAASTRLWYCWHCLRGDLIYILRDAHQKYGEVVRIAPDELSYINPDAWKDIYGHRPGKVEITKDPLFYSNLSSGAGSIINADRSRHGHLRKQMSHGFSEKALRKQEPVIRNYADLLVQRLQGSEAAGNATVDIVSWFNFFTFDVMGDLVFGQSFNCLESSSYHPWVKLIFDSVKMSAFVRCSKYWPFLTPLVRHFIPTDLKNRRLEQRRMAKEKAAYREAITDGRQDLISGFLEANSGITNEEYQSTVETLIIAGSETTATAMSGATYYLLKNPEKMNSVVAEVRSAFSSPDEINFVSVNKLPYLLACLNETLRIYPPVADAFPRNTGATAEVIGGKIVPPHTIVRMTQWATFHSPSNFTQPDDFIPERWIGDHEAFERDRREALQPFHVGPRNCLGRNLAFVEMRLLMALLLWHFDLELDPRSEKWNKQKAFLLWEKPAMFVKISRRSI